MEYENPKIFNCMKRRRKHRSCFCEVLLLRIIKQQKTVTVLQKHSLKNQTRTESKQCTQRQEDQRQTTTERRLQR